MVGHLGAGSGLDTHPGLLQKLRALLGQALCYGTCKLAETSVKATRIENLKGAYVQLVNHTLTQEFRFRLKCKSFDDYRDRPRVQLASVRA